DRADRDRLLTDVEVEEAADLALRIELGRLLLEAPDAEHLPEQVHEVLSGGRAHASLPSRVEVSPSGRPSSRALSRRRMILPLRVFGSVARIAISRGATAGPSRTRACARIERTSSGDSTCPSRSE